jgi:hypothetical protein
MFDFPCSFSGRAKGTPGITTWLALCRGDQMDLIIRTLVLKGKHAMQARTIILVLLVVLFGGAGLLTAPSQPARASHLTEGIWANAVNACAIDEVDLGEYAFGPRGLNHKAGIVGPIVARCNVENLPIHPPFDAPVLHLIYRDQDGAGAGSRVVAKLMMLTNSGAIATIATVDSNSIPCPAGSPSFQSCSAQFSHDFNFDSNAYYVEVTVIRRDTSQVPIAAIVRITGTLL